MADPRTDRIAARHVAPHIRVVTAAAAALAFWQIGWISVQSTSMGQERELRVL